MLQRRRLLRRDAALRHHLHRASRPGRRTTPTCTRLRGHRRRRHAVGLYLLDLYTRDSKRGGAWMNPLVSQSPARHAAGRRGQQPQRAQAGRGRADPADASTRSSRSSTSSGTRCTACSPGSPTRSSPARTSSATSSSSRARSTRCGCCGRRCSPTTPCTTRPASRCRGARGRASAPPRPSTRASRPASTSPPRCSTRPGTAVTGCRRGRHGRRRLRGGSPRGGRAGQPGRSHRGTRATYFAHIFAGGYDAGLLLLHLERGAGCRHGRVVHGERRADPRERRPVPGACCSASADRRTRWTRTATSADAMP